MPRILISASFSESELARQTPGGTGRWQEFQFVFSPTDEPIDGWVVYDDLRQPLEQMCPPENTLLITGEPASIRQYRSRFTSQFSQVWTAQAGIKHPRLSYCNEGQPWHYARRSSMCHGQPLSFDQLAALGRPHKPRMLSVICSSKTITPDQRQRREFVSFLETELGCDIDVYGRGIRPLTDKADAIFPYKYHIVLENDHAEHFMTEKISDAYLGWSYPIYFGGSEANHRFPEGSFTAIDIYQPEQALAIIRDCLDANTYEASGSQIAAARESVLTDNNLFSMVASYWRANLRASRARPTTLLPKSYRTSLVLHQIGRAVAGSRRAA